MATPEDIIRMDAAFGPGTRIVCPFCHGGSSNEKSMIVWSETNYKCYRASCGKVSFASHTATPRTIKPPKYHVGPTMALSADQIQWFCEKFHLDRPPPGTLYDPDADRYLHYIRGPDLMMRGVIARSYTGELPKVLAFKGKVNEPWLHYVHSYGTIANGVVMVEDVISAEKVAQTGIVHAVALVGTHLDLERLTEIVLWHDEMPIFIALDKDATGKAIRYVAKYNDMCSGRLRVIPLEQDFKDVTRQDAKKVIQDAVSAESSWSNPQQQTSV